MPDIVKGMKKDEWSRDVMYDYMRRPSYYDPPSEGILSTPEGRAGVADVALDLSPAGDIKALAETVAGRNLVTGEELGGVGRALTGLSILPLVPTGIRKLSGAKKARAFGDPAVTKRIIERMRMRVPEVGESFGGYTKDEVRGLIDQYIIGRGQRELMKTGQKASINEILEMYAPLRENMQQLVDHAPASFWKHIRKFEGSDRLIIEEMEGAYRKTKHLPPSMKGELGGEAFLSYKTISPGSTAAHELFGHGAWDIVHNYVTRTNPSGPLRKVMDHMEKVHRHAYEIRDIADEAHQRVQAYAYLRNKAGPPIDEIELSKLQDIVTELEDLASAAHGASPEELFANWQKYDYLNFMKTKKLPDTARANLKRMFHERKKTFEKLHKLEQRIKAVDTEVRDLTSVSKNEKIRAWLGMPPLEGAFKRKTGIPNIDQMLKNPDYWAKAKGVKAKVVEMSPDEYLMKVVTGFQRHGYPGASMARTKEMVRSHPSFRDYVLAHRRGDEFPMPHLDYSRGTFNQEGRHRVLAAKEAGLKTIPVAIVEDVVKGSTSRASNKAAREAILKQAKDLPTYQREMLEDLTKDMEASDLERILKEFKEWRAKK